MMKNEMIKKHNLFEFDKENLSLKTIINVQERAVSGPIMCYYNLLIVKLIDNFIIWLKQASPKIRINLLTDLWKQNLLQQY